MHLHLYYITFLFKSQRFMVKAIALLKIDYDDLGLFKLGFQKNKIKFHDFCRAIFCK
jgi:hypothetical protein